MSWLAGIPVALVSVLVLFLPGAALLAAAGGRRFSALAVAPAVSVAIYAVLAILFPIVKLPWNVTTVAVCATALIGFTLAASVLVGRLRPRRASPLPESRQAGTVVAVVLAAVLIGTQLVIVHGEPDHVSQTFDAAFHLNGVKYMLETANASSFHLSGLILPEGASSFYPAAWHAVVALVTELTGGSVVVATTMVNIAIAALVWPLGSILLTRTVFPGSRVAVISAGVLSAAIPAFPILPLDYGVLYPYFLALALLPGAIALGLSLTSLIGRSSTPVGLRIFGLGASLVAIGLSQPSVVFAWAALLVPAAVAMYLRIIRGASARSRAVATGVLVALIGALGAGWLVFGRVGLYSPWGPYTNPPVALFELFTNSREGTPIAIVVSVLVIVGLVSLIRSRDRWWLAGSWAVAAVLFLSAASMHLWTPRNLLLGLFYKDPPRLAALLAVAALPVAVAGAVAVWAFLVARVWPRLRNRFGSERRRPLALAAAAVTTVALVASTQGIAMQSAVAVAATKYNLTEWSPILSIDERTLIERLDTVVPADAIIVGNPWTGTSLSYVLGDRRVLNPHFNVSADPRHVLINMHLADATSDPEVCDALAELGVKYALDFGVYTRDAGGVLSFDSTTDFRGLVDLADSGVVTELDREGDKVLYEITGCD